MCSALTTAACPGWRKKEHGYSAISNWSFIRTKHGWKSFETYSTPTMSPSAKWRLFTVPHFVDLSLTSLSPLSPPPSSPSASSYTRITWLLFTCVPSRTFHLVIRILCAGENTVWFESDIISNAMWSSFLARFVSLSVSSTNIVACLICIFRALSTIVPATFVVCCCCSCFYRFSLFLFIYLFFRFRRSLSRYRNLLLQTCI